MLRFYRDERALLRSNFDGETPTLPFETLTEEGWKENGTPSYQALELTPEQAEEFGAFLFGEVPDLEAPRVD